MDYFCIRFGRGAGVSFGREDMVVWDLLLKLCIGVAFQLDISSLLEPIGLSCMYNQSILVYH